MDRQRPRRRESLRPELRQKEGGGSDQDRRDPAQQPGGQSIQGALALELGRHPVAPGKGERCEHQDRCRRNDEGAQVQVMAPGLGKAKEVRRFGPKDVAQNGQEQEEEGREHADQDVYG